MFWKGQENYIVYENNLKLKYKYKQLKEYIGDYIEKLQIKLGLWEIQVKKNLWIEILN